MISASYLQQMAGYNHRQNQSLYREADLLSEEQRREDRGVFFGSIHRTLCHILTADQIWMSRFDNWDMPDVRGGKSPDWITGWAELKDVRQASDDRLPQWGERIKDTDLQGDLTWQSGIAGEDDSAPTWALVTHMFNHQTHHRGQVHGMLTGFGMVPDETDFEFMPLSGT